MPRLTTLLLTILLLALLASFAWSDDGVDITEPRKVAALTGLQEKIDSVSAGVGDCLKAGKAHSVCMCANEEIILNFNRTVKELFETYPDLKAVDLVRFKMPNGLSVAQNLSGIKNQARMKLSCH